MVDAVLEFKVLEAYEDLHADLDYYAISVSKVALDDLLLRKALKWSDYTCAHETNHAQRAIYLKTKAILLEKLGRDNEAALARKEAANAEKM
ncbi:MAG: hypothetical protein MUC59_14970, partial [Saprospiraceae bacterium]|nr:hypothetical protein [Saprospiraceae bacterium]